jgi:putative transposase
VDYVKESFGLSARRSCGLIGLSRNTLRYERKPDKDGPIRERLKELAEQRRRSGCQLFHEMMKREGLVINHKRTERIYKEEGLSLTIRRRKKRASCARVEIPRAEKKNELWGLDFMHDSMGQGRKLRILPILDTYTKECHRIEVDRSIGGRRVTEVLSEVSSVEGLPENIVIDNGPEFISNAMDEWAYTREVTLHFIRPGKPVDNAFMESFNARLREECLNLNWFRSIEHARRVIEEWRIDYNETRPHSSLGFLTPKEFAEKEEEDFTGKL